MFDGALRIGLRGHMTAARDARLGAHFKLDRSRRLPIIAVY